MVGGASLERQWAPQYPQQLQAILPVADLWAALPPPPPTVTEEPMGNVTDSLDPILAELAELEHQLDDVRSLLHRDDDEYLRMAEHALAALAVARASLRTLIVHTEAERRLLAQLAGLVTSLRCENCHRWFECPSATAKRREYCSPACRTAAYRARLDAYALAHPEAPR